MPLSPESTLEHDPSGPRTDVDWRVAEEESERWACALRESEQGFRLLVDSVTSMGIAPDLMPDIFELFSQGKQGIERQLGGFGIGLAVAKRLVEVHAGEIRAESEGVGRRFIVTLPRSEETVEATPPSDSLPRPRGVGRRVLVVDDNADTNEMMREFLQSLGHEVAVAGNGPRGLELARDRAPDIAFRIWGYPA